MERTINYDTVATFTDTYYGPFPYSSYTWAYGTNLEYAWSLSGATLTIYYKDDFERKYTYPATQIQVNEETGIAWIWYYNTTTMTRINLNTGQVEASLEYSST